MRPSASWFSHRQSAAPLIQREKHFPAFPSLCFSPFSFFCCCCSFSLSLSLLPYVAKEDGEACKYQREAFNQRAWKILFARFPPSQRPTSHRVTRARVFLCTRGSITHQTNVPRLTPRFPATRVSFFSFFFSFLSLLPFSSFRELSTRSQDLGLLIDSNSGLWISFARVKGYRERLREISEGENRKASSFTAIRTLSRITRDVQRV